MSKVLIYAADAEEAKALAIVAAPIAGGPPAALLSGGALPEVEAAALAATSGEVGADVIVAAASKKGNEVAARAAEILDAGCVTEALSVAESGGSLTAKRAIYGGVAVGEFAFEAKPAVLTIALSALAGAEGDSAYGEVSATAGEDAGYDKELVKSEPLAKTVDLTKAKRIVSFGRGLAKKEDIGEVETLAKGLGAEIGCSRPIAEELKWLPQEHQVGITGAIVKPDLYIALGISGAIQHFAGMKDAKVIVAVNSNKNAPIFQFADYGIVGDIYEVVPALEQAISG